MAGTISFATQGGATQSADQVLQALSSHLPTDRTPATLHTGSSKSSSGGTCSVKSQESWLRRSMTGVHKKLALSAESAGSALSQLGLDSSSRRQDAPPGLDRLASSPSNSEGQADGPANQALHAPNLASGCFDASCQVIDSNRVQAQDSTCLAGPAPAAAAQRCDPHDTSGLHASEVLDVMTELMTATVHFDIRWDRITQTAAWTGTGWVECAWPHVVDPGSVWAELSLMQAMQHISPVVRMPDVCINGCT